MLLTPFENKVSVGTLNMPCISVLKSWVFWKDVNSISWKHITVDIVFVPYKFNNHQASMAYQDFCAIFPWNVLDIPKPEVAIYQWLLVWLHSFVPLHQKSQYKLDLCTISTLECMMHVQKLLSSLSSRRNYLSEILYARLLNSLMVHDFSCSLLNDESLWHVLYFISIVH